MHAAARWGRVKAVEVLYAFGADLDAIYGSTNGTPLLQAAMGDKPDTFQTLLNLGADTTNTGIENWRWPMQQYFITANSLFMAHVEKTVSCVCVENYRRDSKSFSFTT